MTPALIVVTGAPGSGKSTVAVPLAARLGLPLIAKDELKEALWNQLRPGDRELSTRTGGRATRSCSWSRGCSSAPEPRGWWRGNFTPEWAAEELQQLRAEAPFRFVQFCAWPIPRRASCGRERAGSDARHPMHRAGGEEADASVERRLREGLWESPIPLDGALFTLDTNEPVDVDALADAVRAALTAA